MRSVMIIAAALFTALPYAHAGEADWRVGGELGFEFATGLGFDHDENRTTPPFRVEDFRYTLEAFAGVGYETAHYNFDLRYKFDQRSYEEYNVLHRERQEVTAIVSTVLLPGTDFSLRYRFRRSQPQGQLGTIDYNQVRGRLRLPEFHTGILGLNLRPYAMANWNTGDFKEKDGLDGTGWGSTGGALFSNPESNWQSDISVEYGERQAQFFFFTYDYIDTSASYQTTLGSWARWVGMDTASAEFELTYREEWYDGGLADDGTHRHDQELGASFDINRRMTANLEFTGTVEIENHESNWISQDFIETRTMIGFRAEF